MRDPSPARSIERVGAKLVLVGDPEQLQAIGAGAPLRAIAERVGVATLEAVRRQREGWQRDATAAFASGRTGDGLRAYAADGAVRFEATGAEAQAALVRDYLADRVINPEGTRLALAHRRADVAGLNEAVREGRKERGELVGGRVYRTDDGRQAGTRAFAAGDRLVFLANDRAMGVKNGTLGTVTAVAAGRIEVRLDGAKGEGRGRRVGIDTAAYGAFDHGYATTIHKSQGATVDRAFVLASASMDRHLSYVAMSRHRDAAGLYAGRDQFPNVAAMTQRLGRAGAKATTLDYAQAYAERRGLAASLGLVSRIEVTAPSPARAAVRDTVPAARDDGRRPANEAGQGRERETMSEAWATRKAAWLMAEWRETTARLAALGNGEADAVERAGIVGRLGLVAKRIEDQPQVAAIVRARGAEIGLERTVAARDVGAALRQAIERGRSQDRGMER